MKFGMQIISTKPISTTYVFHKSLSICLSICVISFFIVSQRLGKNSPLVAMQKLGINLTATTNTDATIELLGASLSMWPDRLKEHMRLVCLELLAQ
jgi:hypothetical protein